MIGKALYTMLYGNTAIKAIVSNRIYPISNKAEALPSIYYIVRMLPHYNKNGQQTQDWKVTILTMCKNYNEAWDLAIKVKNLFEGSARNATVSSIRFVEARCTAIADDFEFQVDSYGQTIEFDMRTQSITS